MISLQSVKYERVSVYLLLVIVLAAPFALAGPDGEDDSWGWVHAQARVDSMADVDGLEATTEHYGRELASVRMESDGRWRELEQALVDLLLAHDADGFGCEPDNLGLQLELLDLRSARRGPRSLQTGLSHLWVASAMMTRGRYGEAEKHLGRAEDIWSAHRDQAGVEDVYLPLALARYYTHEQIFEETGPVLEDVEDLLNGAPAPIEVRVSYLRSRGDHLVGLSEYDEARILKLKALDLARQSLRFNPTHLAEIELEGIEVLHHQMRFEETIPLLEHFLPRAEAGYDRSQEISVLRWLSTAHGAQWRFEKNARFADQAYHVFEEICPGLPPATDFLVGLAASRWVQMNLAEADSIVDLALEQSERKPRTNFSTVKAHFIKTLIAAYAGQIDVAEYHRQRCRDLLETTTAHPKPRLVISAMLRMVGTLNGNSAPTLEEALAILAALEEYHGPNSLVVADTIIAYAFVFRAVDEVDIGMTRLAQAQRIFVAELGQGSEREAICYLEMAHTLAPQAGEEGIELAGRAISILERRGDLNSMYYFRALSVMSSCLSMTARYEEALKYGRLADRVVVDLAGSHAAARLRGLAILADACGGWGRPQAAYGYSDLATTLSLENYEATVHGLSEDLALARKLEPSGHLDHMLYIAAAAPDSVDPTRAWNHLIRSRSIVLNEFNLRLRKITQRDDPRQTALVDDLRRAQAAYSELLMSASPAGDPDFLDELERSRQLVARAQATLALELPRERDGHQDAPRDLAAVEMALPEGAALVSFAQCGLIPWEPFPGAPHLGGDRGKAVPSYLALILTGPGREPRVQYLGPAARVDSLVHAWHGLISDPGAGLLAPTEALERYRDTGRAVRREIWDPVAQHLDGADEVFLVPEGGLHLLNWLTLPEDDDRFLIDGDQALHVLTAEADLVTSRVPEAEAGSLLTVGAIDYDRAAPASAATPAAVENRFDGLTAADVRRSGISSARFADIMFPSLPHSGEETAALEELWRGLGPGRVERLSGASATESAFESVANGMTVIHLATHGFVVGDECLRPRRDYSKVGWSPVVEDQLDEAGTCQGTALQFSGLVFAGANRRNESAPGEDDGILTAADIAMLDLGATRWMVLSACESGLGSTTNLGEGVFGLRRACLIAGVRTVIMSLWSVEDASTAAWMGDLYRARFVEGLDTSHAIRRASGEELARRRAAGGDVHPHHWGAFMSVGDWR